MTTVGSAIDLLVARYIQYTVYMCVCVCVRSFSLALKLISPHAENASIKISLAIKTIIRKLFADTLLCRISSLVLCKSINSKGERRLRAHYFFLIEHSFVRLSLPYFFLTSLLTMFSLWFFMLNVFIFDIIKFFIGLMIKYEYVAGKHFAYFPAVLWGTLVYRIFMQSFRKSISKPNYN